MLNDQQWEQYTQLMYKMRDFSRDGEMLIFTSKSMADLLLVLSRPLLKTENEEPVLTHWEKEVEPFLIRLHEEARSQNPTVELEGQTYRVVSEGVARSIKGWMDDNCPRGID